MKIAHISATFPPYKGGTGNVCLHNARELARRGHEVTVFTAAQGAPTTEARDGFSVRRLRALVRVGNAPLLPNLLPALRGFDMVHLHYPFFGGDALTLAAVRREIPLVITYHQDVLLSGPMAVAEHALRHTVGRATLRAAQRVLFTSLDYSRASYARPLLAGRESSIDELPNGVDTEFYCPGEVPAGLRELCGVGPDDRVCMLVAGLDQAHYFKGVGVLLGALEQLPRHIKAVIVGDGDLRPQYEAEAQRRGLAGRVHFAGRTSDSELRDLYRMADMTVLPSVTMGEAFGLVLVESLACGTPVVASNLPGVRTVVSHTSDGFLVPPGDTSNLAATIDVLAGNDEMRRSFGRRGRVKVAERYDWTQIGERLEAIYAHVLDEHRVAAAIPQEGA